MSIFNSVDRGSYSERVQIDRLWMVALGAIALSLMTLNLGGLSLRDAGESTVAQIAKEIWQAPVGTMRWLYPTLMGEPYLNKPPLLQNLMAIAFQLGGLHEWTARLPGALFTTLSVPLLYAVGRELFYRPLPALFSALVYLTTLPVLRVGRLAMLEGTVLCFSLLMMWCALRSRRDVRYALGIGIGFGLLCLTKGLMLGLLLGAIALLFLQWDTPRLLSIPFLWLGIALGSLPLAFWYAAQWWHYGAATLWQNLLEQSFSRIWFAVEDDSGAPWFYLGELLKGGLPWLLFVPMAIRRAWSDRKLGWAKLALLWAGVYLLAISLMATKLPWYSLPLYPPLALMVGAQLAALWEQGRHDGILQPPLKPYSRSWIWTLGGAAGGAIAASMLVFHQRHEGQLSLLSIHLPIPDLPAILVPMLLLIGITLAIAAILISQDHPQFVTVLLWGTYLSLMLLFASPYWVWELTTDYSVKPVAQLIQQHTPPGEVVHMAALRSRPSLSFYSDRTVVAAAESSPTGAVGDRLQQLWQQESQVYLLLDHKTLNTVALPQKQILGETNGWTLVAKR